MACGSASPSFSSARSKITPDKRLRLRGRDSSGFDSPAERSPVLYLLREGADARWRGARLPLRRQRR